VIRLNCEAAMGLTTLLTCSGRAFSLSKKYIYFSPLKAGDNSWEIVDFAQHVTFFLQFSACIIDKNYLLSNKDLVFFSWFVILIYFF
jgi:hypothetical protein